MFYFFMIIHTCLSLSLLTYRILTFPFSPLDNMFYFETPGMHHHNVASLTTPRQVFKFSVEACKEVRIALAQTPGVYGAEAYEVSVNIM